MGPLEASALGGNTSSPQGKVTWYPESGTTLHSLATEAHVYENDFPRVDARKRDDCLESNPLDLLIANPAP